MSIFMAKRRRSHDHNHTRFICRWSGRQVLCLRTRASSRWEQGIEIEPSLTETRVPPPPSPSIHGRVCFAEGPLKKAHGGGCLASGIAWLLTQRHSFCGCCCTDNCFPCSKSLPTCKGNCRYRTGTGLWSVIYPPWLLLWEIRLAISGGERLFPCDRHLSLFVFCQSNCHLAVYSVLGGASAWHQDGVGFFVGFFFFFGGGGLEEEEGEWGCVFWNCLVWRLSEGRVFVSTPWCYHGSQAVSCLPLPPSKLPCA